MRSCNIRSATAPLHLCELLIAWNERIPISSNAAIDLGFFDFRWPDDFRFARHILLSPVY